VNPAVRLLRGDDIDEVVAIHCESFPDSRSTRLGKPFLRRMYQWYLVCQPRLSLVGEMDGKVVGFVTGTFGWGGARRRFRYTLRQILWGFIRRPSLLVSAEMFERWENFLKGLMPGSLMPGSPRVSSQPHSKGVKVTLDSIAVSPKARGRNVGTALMNAFEDAAEKLGAGFLALGVERDGIAARRLYESCGWELLREDTESNSVNYVKKFVRG